MYVDFYYYVRGRKSIWQGRRIAVGCVTQRAYGPCVAGATAAHPLIEAQGRRDGAAMPAPALVQRVL